MPDFLVLGRLQHLPAHEFPQLGHQRPERKRTVTVNFPRTVARSVLKRISRSDRARQKKILRASRHVINQLSGFSLSDFHLSSQIHTDGWAFLNPKSIRLDKASLRKISDGAVIYVNVQETDLFVTNYLPHISSSFVLISGEIWSPLQPRGAAVDTVLSHPGLLSWFCQNREVDDLPLKPFPFGVALRGIATVSEAVIRHRHTPKDADIYVSHAAVHPHLEPHEATMRKGLQPFMAPPQRHKDYLAELARHRFVISPPGDRPDTFRHWESVALGAIPVSTLPTSFQELFGDSLILVDDLVAHATGPFDSSREEADRALATVDYWRQVIDQARQQA